MKTLIRNGKIVNPRAGKSFVGSILVEDGVVTKIAAGDMNAAGAEAIDASGLSVVPGLIDMHVHFRDPGFEYKEDIVSGLEAAAAGGFTAVCTMPNTSPSCDNIGTIEYQLKKARTEGNGVRLFPVAAASKGLKGETMAPIGELKEAGAVAISDDGKPISDSSLLLRVMQYAATFGLTYLSHAEDLSLAKGGQMNESYFSTLYGLPPIPSVAESIVVARECLMAQYLGLPVHICHVSTKAAVDTIAHFKKLGVKVTAETAPHYLTLTDEAVGSYDTNTKVNPPLRSEDDRKALLAALKDGTIDAIATDHAPHHERDKNVEFNTAPSGMVGLETAVPLLLKTVQDGHISFDRFVELFTAGYGILGIEGGVIAEGKRADLTLIAPDYQWTIDKNMFLSRSRNTPFHGFHVTGAVFRTIVGGKTVFSRTY
ncbi:MAG TPA: dihydroorotase [bacterium]|nr:dihydroorotase [bacterium]